MSTSVRHAGAGGGAGTEEERDLPKVTQQIQACWKGSQEAWPDAPHWFHLLPWP